MELSEKVVFSHSALPSKCFDAFQNMRNSGKCCDVRIKLQNCTILAHLVILHAVFPGLKDLLENKNTGSNEKEINTENIDPSALETLIDFAYSCKLEITNDNVEDLLLTALYLKADEIVNACCDFISKRINVENAIKKLQFAENLHLTALAKTCSQFIRENFDEVSETEGFLQAPWFCVKELICADDLRTSCEETVFEAVMRWIKWYPLERKSDLPELLSCVRLALIKPEYVREHVATDEYIRNSLVCRDLLDDVKDYHLLPKRRSELCSLVTRPRKKMCFGLEESDIQCDVAVAGIYIVSKRAVYNLQCLNVETGEWERPKYFENFYHSSTVTSSSDTIYFSDMEGLASHDIASENWDFNRKIWNPKRCASSAILQNKLYVCGGTDGRSCFDSVYCYDLKSKIGETVCPMNTGRVLPGIVPLGQFLYVLGGFNVQRTSQQSVEKYDPNSKTWTLLSPMLIDRHGLGCAALNEKIYVCGGKSLSFNEVLNSAEVYCPVRNNWEFISPMKTQRFNFSLVSDGKKLYAVGGCVDDQLLNSIEVYDPETDVWEFGPDLDPTQKYVQAFAVGYPVAELKSRQQN